MNKKKKGVIVFLTVLLIIGVISGVVLLVLNQFEKEEIAEEEKKVIGMYGSTVTYTFYPIESDLNPDNYPEYKELDSDIHLTCGSESILIDYDKAHEYGKDVKLLADYIQYAKDGDYESLNALFSENYYKKYEPYYSFTKQMLYDISLDFLGEETVDGTKYFMYDVSYKIFRNNGTFRNDFGKDSSRKLYFRLAEKDTVILIDNVEYYK